MPPSPTKRFSPFASLRRGLCAFFLGLAACLLAMLLSYATVRYLTRGVKLWPPEETAAGEVFRHASALGVLAEEYAERIPLDAPGLSPEAARWINEEFRPRLEALRRHLDASGTTAQSGVRVLRDAVDRAAVMAAHPGDQELRRRAITELRRAVEWNADGSAS